MNNLYQNKYGLGCEINPKDNRDIPVSAVQAPVGLPQEYFTDISWIPVLNQRNLGACVGHAHALIPIYNDYLENGVKRNLSPRYLYALSKQMDGLASQGTYPRCVDSILLKKGCATEGFCPNDTQLSHEEYINVSENEEIKKDALPYKIKGFAYVDTSSPETIKQAIFQNKLVTITLPVGDWSQALVKRNGSNVNYHRITLYGYSGNRFYFRNSWGNQWGDNGNGYFDFDEYKGFMLDAWTYVDMPNTILEEARKGYRYFSKQEVDTFKLKPEFWAILDELRHRCGFPFVIVSGFRTKEHNDEVGGVENSAHLSGLAVDVKCDTAEKRFKMITEAIKLGITRIGINRTTLHLDIDKTKTGNVVWHYYK